MRTAMRPRLRVQQVVNLVNGSTLTGLGVAALGGAAVARSADGLFTGTGMFSRSWLCSRCARAAAAW